MHLGLDVGTSGTKASVFDTNGRMLSSALESYDFCAMDSVRRELDMERVVSASLRVLAKAALESGASKSIRTVTVSSLGEAIVLLDSADRILRTSITGTDMRGAEQLERITGKLGIPRLTKITGLATSILYSLPKLMWVKEHQPDIWDRTARIFTVQDYVAFRLSGEAAIDHSLASRTMLFDINSLDWSDELLGECGIARRALPKPVPSGTAIGVLRPEIAEGAGLNASAMVVIGAHDHLCNALGCGAVDEGMCTNSTGTTEGLTAVLYEKLNVSEIIEHNITCEPHAIAGLYATVAWNNTAGALIKWFARQLARERQGGDIYDYLNALCGGEPTSLLVLPHFSGAATPHMDPLSKGAIVGLTLSSTREDIYKALMEGTAFELAQILERLRVCKVDTKRVVVCGGGSKSRLWMQIKADILGLEVLKTESFENGTMGCAMLGARACGDFADIRDAASSMVRYKLCIEPDPKRQAIYWEKFELYKKLFGSLIDINRKL